MGLDRRRLLIIGKTPEALSRNQGPVISDCQRRTGKRALGDGLTNDGEGPRELPLLPVESGTRRDEFRRR